MSFLKTIWSDLIEKRLWPIAAALVIALVAIPFLIKSNATSSAPSLALNTPTTPSKLGPAALSAPQVKLLQSRARHKGDGARSPFSQPRIPASSVTVAHDKTVSTTPATTAPPAAPPATPIKVAPIKTTPVKTTPVKTTPVKTTPTPTTGPTTPTTPDTPPVAPKPDTNLFRVSLRVGQSGDLKTVNRVERLSPLPSVSDPFFVFMGVLTDGKTAVFLLSSDATATGDGVCKPTPTDCETVEMKVDDIEFFDVAGTDPKAAPTQYELDLNHIVKTQAATGAIAAKARAQVAESGRNVVAEHSDQLTGYSYSARSGLLARRLPTLAAALPNIARSPSPAAPATNP